MQEKIYIIGAGAIGRALAVFLQEENKEVILVRGSVDHQPTEIKSITVVNQGDQQFRQEILTLTFDKLDEIEGVVLVTTKTFANLAIARKLKLKKGKFAVVLLQNGLNVEEPFYDFSDVYRCVLFSTSQILFNEIVSFKTVTPSPIGHIRGDNSQTEKIVQRINTPYFTFRSEPNIEKIIWTKVIINCAFNSICPLLELDNGIFYRNQKAMTLAKSIISECTKLAQLYKVNLKQEEVEEKLLVISERASGQLISTYEDIRKNRRTEIDSLNLEIARLAEKIGQAALVANTKMLGEMIKIKSEIYLKQ